MRKLLYLLVFLIIGFIFYSCGIDVPEIETKLKTPLGLSATATSNGTVILEWWSYNDEEYFSGYVIFISYTYDILVDQSKTFAEKPKLLNESGSLPTVPYFKFTSPKVFRLEVSKDSQNFPLLNGFKYYFGVAAYSISKNIYSPMSNITNAVITNY